MDQKGRRTRFQERVRVERDFLNPVNKLFGASAPLAGMTRDAILSWERRAKRDFPGDIVESISGIITEASRRAELLADNSRDIFEKGRLVPLQSLETLRQQLAETLESNKDRLVTSS